MKKQKQIEQGIHQLRKYVKWAIYTFGTNENPEELNFVDPRRKDGWVIHTNRNLYIHIRNVIIPSLLTIYEEQHLITPEKHQALLSQINSPDREDWYLAFVVIDQINPHKN
jgi:hypothetical protein